MGQCVKAKFEICERQVGKVDVSAFSLAILTLNNKLRLGRYLKISQLTEPIVRTYI